MAIDPRSTEAMSSAFIADERRQAVVEARAIALRVRQRADRTEKARCVPSESIQELLESGLFGILKPRVFGGAELGVAALVEVTAELAAACGSTGWVYGVLAGHSWMVNLFPVEAQREVFGDPDALIATVFRLGGKITSVDGGYRLVNGEGRFCSGIDHVSWVIVGGAVAADRGPPEPRFFLVPSADIEVIDDWHAVGLRGTGSRSIRIAEAFIPAHRSVSLGEMASGTSPGAQFHAAPLYKMPFQLVAPFSIIGAPLGIARGALDTYVKGFAGYLKNLDDTELAAQSATMARAGHAAADIDAAFALVLEDAKGIDEAASPKQLTDLQKARVPRNWSYAAQTTRRSVGRIFEATGGTAVYDGSDIQRSWRDINAAAQHYAFIWDNAMVDYGRALLGLAALHAIPKKR